MRHRRRASEPLVAARFAAGASQAAHRTSAGAFTNVHWPHAQPSASAAWRIALHAAHATAVESFWSVHWMHAHESAAPTARPHISHAVAAAGLANVHALQIITGRGPHARRHPAKNRSV